MAAVYVGPVFVVVYPRASAAKEEQGAQGKTDIQLRLDALGRRDSQQALSNTGRETRQRRARARHLAFRVGEKALVLVEGDES